MRKALLLKRTPRDVREIQRPACGRRDEEHRRLEIRAVNLDEAFAKMLEARAEDDADALARDVGLLRARPAKSGDDRGDSNPGAWRAAKEKDFRSRGNPLPRGASALAP